MSRFYADPDLGPDMCPGYRHPSRYVRPDPSLSDAVQLPPGPASAVMGWLVDLGRLNPDCVARRHGDYAAYRNGCRCPHAREHNRIYNKRMRERRAVSRFAPATGTARRLQALAVLGWRWTDVAERLGVSWQAVQQYALSRNPTVHVITANRVRAVYRELHDRRGPSDITRRRAIAKGWVSPLAWANIDDPDCVPDLGTGVVAEPIADVVAVREFLAGRLPAARLSDADRVEVYRRLSAEGASQWKVRQVLGVTKNRMKTIAAAA